MELSKRQFSSNAAAIVADTLEDFDYSHAPKRQIPRSNSPMYVNIDRYTNVTQRIQQPPAAPAYQLPFSSGGPLGQSIVHSNFSPCQDFLQDQMNHSSLGPGIPSQAWSPHSLFHAVATAGPSTGRSREEGRQKRDGQVASLSSGSKRARPAGGGNAVAKPPEVKLNQVGEQETEEEQRQRRIQHRQAGVTAVKNSSDYQLVSRMPSHCAVVAPDPHDATISKRTWERQMQEWRKELRRIVVAATQQDDETILSQ